jgi:hypothetical protein
VRTIILVGIIAGSFIRIEVIHDDAIGKGDRFPEVAPAQTAIRDRESLGCGVGAHLDEP